MNPITESIAMEFYDEFGGRLTSLFKQCVESHGTLRNERMTAFAAAIGHAHAAMLIWRYKVPPGRIHDLKDAVHDAAEKIAEEMR